MSVKPNNLYRIKHTYSHTHHHHHRQYPTHTPSDRDCHLAHPLTGNTSGSRSRGSGGLYTVTGNSYTVSLLSFVVVDKHKMSRKTAKPIFHGYVLKLSDDVIVLPQCT